VLTAFRLIKRVGKFRDVNAGRVLPLDRLTLIYADNGRGKTTLSAILRSLGTGDPTPILERRRIDATEQPDVILDSDAGTLIFRDGRWSTPGPKVAIFDDTFVADNVHSGMAVDGSHRQQLHDLIIGARGVSLNKTLQEEIARNEQHIKTLAKGGDLIPKRLRGDMAPDKFCDIQAIPDLAAQLVQTERMLAAARDSDAVVRRPSLPVVALPRFDARVIEDVLGLTLEDIQQEALIKVQRHIKTLGGGGEAWIADGQSRHAHAQGEVMEICPYCAQPLSASHVAEHYDAYFSESYRQLRQTIERTGKDISAQHTGNATAEFQRQVRILGEEIIQWGRFIAAKPVVIPADDIIKLWHAAATPVLAVLRQKFTAPLEKLSVDQTALAAIEVYHRAVDDLDDAMAAVDRMNSDIAVVKEGAAAGNPSVLERDLARLRTVEARYSPEGKEVAARYDAERLAKTETEVRKDAARTELDEYRRNIFPRYQDRINHYLRALHAGYRLSSVSPVNSRQGSSANYQVLLDEISVPIPLSPILPNEPSVKTALSAGDRNALALAFFLTSLELDPDTQRLVLLDDPMTSLDEHRTLATVREILDLRHTAGQVIILSHSKPFLFSIWKDTNSNDPRRSLQIKRDSGDTSTFVEWDVSQESVTEHDKRSDLLRRYLDSPVGMDERQVAEALRPILEAFLRVAYPELYPPGALIGGFIRKARETLGTAQERLTAGDVDELGRLTDYANRYHHSNAGFRTEIIHDAELRHNIVRVFAFTRRS
jgi:hypothetical protein